MKSDRGQSQWDDAFAAMESNRRLSSSPQEEAALTGTLTRWVVGLTVAMAVLTVLLAIVGGVDPVQSWRTLDEAVHAGVYGPG
jgi:hypothetical protein